MLVTTAPMLILYCLKSLVVHNITTHVALKVIKKLLTMINKKETCSPQPHVGHPLSIPRPVNVTLRQNHHAIIFLTST